MTRRTSKHLRPNADEGRYLTEEQFRDNNHERNMRSLKAAWRELYSTSRSVESIYGDRNDGARPTKEQSVEMLRMAQAIEANASIIARLCRKVLKSRS